MRRALVKVIVFNSFLHQLKRVHASKLPQFLDSKLKRLIYHFMLHFLSKNFRRSFMVYWNLQNHRERNIWSILIFTRLSHLGIYDKKIIHSATQKTGSFVDGSKWEVSGWVTISVWNPKNNLYAEKWNTWKVYFENMK